MKKDIISEIESAWENIYSDTSWGKYPPEYVIRFLAKFYYNADRKNIHILDVGCGGGAVTWYLAREGFDVYAFDGSKRAVEHTEDYLRENNLSAHVTVQNSLELNYTNDFFDCVIDNASSCCMGTKEEIEKIYRNIYKILRANGRLFSVGFTMECYGAGTGEKIGEGTFKNEKLGMASRGGTIHYTTIDEMYTMLEKAGFGDIQFDTMRYTFYGNVVDMIIAYGRKKGYIDGERVVDMIIADCKKRG